MRIGSLEIRWAPARLVTITTKGRAMSEGELNQAFQVPDTDPQWRATLQLLETAEQNANAQAAASIDQTNRMAGYVGGAEHLALARGDLIRRREAGLAELRARPERETRQD